MGKQNSELYEAIKLQIGQLDTSTIADSRLPFLQALIDFIQEKRDAKKAINLNFICTHNSRRSHLSQIWAQTLAFHFGIEGVHCYSGGTEATAMFPKVKEILTTTGFEITNLSLGENPVYSIKYAPDVHPIIGFSKTYDHFFNPTGNFAAVMTCSHADENCPFIPGAEKRIPFTFDDPKAFDGTPFQTKKYEERSLEIATQLFYVFSRIR
jgi:arsenate reductase